MNHLVVSEREREVLRLIAYEYTSKEIASMLYISPHTTISHRKNLMEKLDVRNTAGLVRRAFETGILSLTQTS
ncbi:MAG: helix-turn-helix transcriptional regulator [Bacteroidota bacterium]